MKRIIFVPQYPTPLRYQEFWYWKFPDEFKKAGYEVYVLGEKAVKYTQYGVKTEGMFSPINAAIKFEAEQINEYMAMDLKEDDILLIADISFPGFFSNVLYHKRPGKVFGYCHATSINKHDYFSEVSSSKFKTESAHAELFDEIFVGSIYHAEKINWSNTVVLRLPFPPFKKYTNLIKRKDIHIASASRITKQKIDYEIEKDLKVVRRHEIKELGDTWRDYYLFLSMSKILLVSAVEETFGYQIVDAIMNNCIPLAPNRCSYPELLSSQYLYNDKSELITKLKLIDEGKLKVPNLMCEGEMKMFYDNLIYRMENFDSTK